MSFYCSFKTTERNLGETLRLILKGTPAETFEKNLRGTTRKSKRNFWKKNTWKEYPKNLLEWTSKILFFNFSIEKNTQRISWSDLRRFLKLFYWWMLFFPALEAPTLFQNDCYNLCSISSNTILVQFQKFSKQQQGTIMEEFQRKFW